MRRWQDLRNIFEQTVHTWLYGDMDLSSIFRRLHQIGADGVDLTIELAGHHSPASLLQMNIRQMAADFELSIPSSTPLFSAKGLDFADPDQAIRQMTIDFAKRSIDVNVHVGCKNMLIVPGMLSVHHKYHTSRQDDWNRVVESLRIVGEYADLAGVSLLIEPINRYRVALVHTVAQALQMIADISMPNFQLVVDTFHMQMEEITGIPDAIRQGGKYIKCVHIGDNTRRPAGLGVFDWKSILLALYDIDFDGPLSYEPVFNGIDLKRMFNDTEYASAFDHQLEFGMDYLRAIMRSIVANDIVT
jgi:sugar phosphate isomerase/epimerase